MLNNSIYTLPFISLLIGSLLAKNVIHYSKIKNFKLVIFTIFALNTHFLFSSFDPKICLDFYIRAGIFLNIEPDLLNWLGARFSPKLLLPPDAPGHAETKYKRWPLFNSQRRIHQHRLVRLLARVLRFDIARISHEQIDIMNDLMMQAWRDLRRARVS